MTDPYAIPDSVADAPAPAELKKRRFWLRAIWISVAGIIVPPLFGLAGTVMGMVSAFTGLSRDGIADPEAVARDVSTSLLATLLGLGVSFIALVFLIVALIRFFRLPKPGMARPEIPGRDRTGHGG
ncbi:MotA/TolQ/ExbB proton channel family protein [Luteolibacter marinus]|uniref:MotA/TolQ/ExbB proton channel family protein n=1 Tax=Luteolibacter marinus TaxID=2776705 RepID=UPI001867B77B|nr:MotA/TolQ/ExbB proton channel family protein [Luteolibacter marinus]